MPDRSTPALCNDTERCRICPAAYYRADLGGVEHLVVGRGAVSSRRLEVEERCCPSSQGESKSQPRAIASTWTTSAPITAMAGKEMAMGALTVPGRKKVGAGRAARESRAVAK